MGLRSWLKRLERGSREELANFTLMDGGRYYYDPATWDVFLHWHGCLMAGNPENWPEPPGVLRKLTEAKDPAQAAEQLMSNTGEFFPYDSETLVAERRLEPRSLVAGRDVNDQEVEDHSE